MKWLSIFSLQKPDCDESICFLKSPSEVDSKKIYINIYIYIYIYIHTYTNLCILGGLDLYIYIQNNIP